MTAGTPSIIPFPTETFPFCFSIRKESLPTLRESRSIACENYSTLNEKDGHDFEIPRNLNIQLGKYLLGLLSFCLNGWPAHAKENANSAEIVVSSIFKPSSILPNSINLSSQLPANSVSVVPFPSFLCYSSYSSLLPYFSFAHYLHYCFH
jgi:hypothetical protein